MFSWKPLVFSCVFFPHSHFLFCVCFIPSSGFSFILSDVRFLCSLLGFIITIIFFFFFIFSHLSFFALPCLLSCVFSVYISFSTFSSFSFSSFQSVSSLPTTVRITLPLLLSLVLWSFPGKYTDPRQEDQVKGRLAGCLLSARHARSN